MSWIYISTALDKLRQLEVDEATWAVWKKRILWLSALGVLITAVIHLAVRFYFWPMVEQNKTQFESMISRTIGAELRIEEIKTDWEVFWPAFKIKNITIHDAKDPNKTPLLNIPEVSGNVSWETLWEMQPHFHNVKFENARLHVKRDAKGHWDVAGIRLDKNSAGFAVGNWIFDQDSMQVNQAEIIWLDQLQQSAEHRIQIESLDLKNQWFKHQISLKLRSPWQKDTATFEAQFRHNTFGNAGNWQDWNGQIKWAIQDLDLRKLNTTIGSKIKIIDGLVTSQGKTYLNSGMADGGETNLEFNDLHFEWDRLGQPLKIMHLQAQILQETYGSKMSISAPKLNWQVDKKTPQQELNDLSFYWKAAPSIQSVEHAGIKASKINIALLEQLAKQFPLPKDIQSFINNYQPSGELEDLDVNWTAQASRLPFNISIPGFNESHYKLSFSFRDLFIQPSKANDWAIANFSGKLFATELGGEVTINNQTSSAVLPKILENDQLEFNRAKGIFKWVKQDSSWNYEFKNMSVLNNDLELTFDANYQPGSKNIEEKLTIKAEIEKAKVANITRYFPLGMSKDARTYINGALKSGYVKNAKLHISGSPNHIPFNTKHPGIFQLQIPIENVEYHPASANMQAKGRWSPFSKVNGTITMNGPELIVDFNDALFESVQLSGIKGIIQDVTSPKAILKINGQASGLSQDLLNYYLMSPSGQSLKSLSERLEIAGSSRLNIHLEMPLADVNKTSIKGEVSLTNNTVNFDKKIEAKEITGDILFSEDSISAKNLKAKLLGGDILISNPSPLPWSEQPGMKVKGHVDIQQLIQALNTSTSDESLKPILNQFDGTVNYDGKLLITSGGYKLDLGIQLQQLSSNFPAPFHKKKGDKLSGEFHLSQSNKDGRQEHIGQIKLGKLIDSVFAVHPKNGMRAGWGVNTAGKLPEKGMSANIYLDQLNIDEWEKWLSKNLPEDTKSSKTKATPFITSFNAQIGKLRIADKNLSQMKLQANYRDNSWQAQLDSPIAVGQVQWRPAQADLPQGKLTARLQKLIIEKSSTGEAVTKSINSRAQKIPAMDVIVEQLTFNQHEYGKMQLLANNDKNDWRIDKLTLKTADAQLEASGRWELPKQGKSPGRTQLNVDLDIDNAGKLLDKLGFPKTIDSGSGKLVGQLNWTGAPYQFEIPSLRADLSLDLAKGTILQVDPGVARLLGVLSYQGLTRIATLDISGVLKPIVTQGTPFDRITSQGKIQNGIARIQDLSIKGPQGNVRLTGSANLIDETQDMRITVVPNFNAGSASLAYTFVNPIIGLSTLVGQYLIADEVSKLFQLDYLVQGTWAAPQVIALDAKGRPLDENKLKEIRDKSLLRQQQNPNKK